MGPRTGCRRNAKEHSALMVEDREQPEHIEGDDLPVQRGVIDDLEGDWARIALDDGQRLDWPRDHLPREAGAGMVVELTVHVPGAPGALTEEGAWEGTVEVSEGAICPYVVICLGRQRLRWPAAGRLAPDERVVVHLELDPEATRQRRKQVEDLVNDLFG
jgi:hypothetical protein